MRKVATIGVYGYTASAFLADLHAADVTLLVDVRQRRGVRGPEYSWANSVRLQRALRSTGIGYEHRKELAPTTALRELQYREDARLGEGKRSRSTLASAYRARYLTEILDRVDLGAIVDSLPIDHASALVCVEREPEACHRSLIAERMAADYAVEVVDLRPRE